MSHFYIVKNIWKPHRKPANLSHFRLPAPIDQKFNRISIDFLQYKNGSKIFYDLLRPISTYSEGPQIFKKNCNRPSRYSKNKGLKIAGDALPCSFLWNFCKKYFVPECFWYCISFSRVNESLHQMLSCYATRCSYTIRPPYATNMCVLTTVHNCATPYIIQGPR